MKTQYNPDEKTIRSAGKSKKMVFLKKVKEHKKEITIVVSVVVLVTVAGFVFKNRTTIKSTIKSLRIEGIFNNSLETRINTGSLISESVEKSFTNDLPDTKIISVKEHIRNLPKGWKPSTSKVKLAKEYGYSLKEYQTWVTPYKKTSALYKV